jgi:phosphoadenosine phosphosulfate reductase
MPDLINRPTAAELLELVIREQFRDEIALVSSFGTESAILLHMIAQIDQTVPVIFLETGKLFDETLDYRDRLATRLGLTDIRAIPPNAMKLSVYDPDGALWRRDPDLCCAIRKTDPLDQALSGFKAWITGRKRSQGGERAGLRLIDQGPDGRVTVNPLAYWSDTEIEAYFERHDLPRHPLQAQGYASIGCATCTRRVEPGEDKRAGRWAGSAKTECGIHRPRRATLAALSYGSEP